MPFWSREVEEPGDTGHFLVVGLGNPGREYADTRHNVGFMVADVLAQQHGMSFKRSKHRAEIARGRIGGVPVILALPSTYMNESGDAVSRLMRYYSIPADRLLVVCDDLDLPFGTLRLRPRGSSGGHRGLASIMRSLGSEEFARLRVGVGRPRGSAVGYVLGRFAQEETRHLSALLSKAADAVTAALERGTAAAMNEFNGDWLPSLML